MWNCWLPLPRTSSAPAPAVRLGACLASLVIVASCVPAPRPTGSTVLFASGADLQSINPLVTVHPFAKQVQKHVLLLPLAAYDSAMRPIPRLGSWQWNANRTEITFDLRQDVSWHDGVLTTADDVVWTLEMAMHPAVAYPRARDLDAIEMIAKVDSFTVTLRFERSQPIFPDVFTDLAMLPRHRFDGVTPEGIRTAPFNRDPVGNGPFVFVEYRPNQRWVFRRAEDFPVALNPPRIDRFVVVIVDESATKLAALTSGELDFAGINPAHASFVRADPRLTVIDYPVQFANALLWNLRREPFADPAMRRALTMGLDRDLLVDAYLYGFGARADGSVAPDHPWYEAPVGVPYDPAAATRLLDGLGWTLGDDGVRERDGRRLTFDLLSVGVADNPLEQMIQAQLRRLGVDVSIRLLELTTFLSVAQGEARDFDALVTLIPGDFSLGHVAALFAGDNPGPLAYAGYESANFDAALDEARRAASASDLEAAWRGAQRVLSEDFPTTWLYHARGVLGANRRVRGVTLDLRGELAGMANWWVPEEREGEGTR